ncbi:MAG: hypothetical protein HKN04_01835 [Rhodothermaceae bacterium]|nr:hypothetical protein [Rhodothermaceae bacterium]
MRYSWFVLVGLFALCVSACTPVETEAEGAEPVVDLVPAEALAEVLPEAIDAHALVSEDIYRGYFTDSTGGTGSVALQTVARTYADSAGWQIVVNAISFDDAARYADLVRATGAFPPGSPQTTDSTGFIDPVLTERFSENTVYAVPLGRIVVLSDHHALEVKSYFTPLVAAALAQVDTDRLAATEPVATTVDAQFQRRAR